MHRGMEVEVDMDVVQVFNRLASFNDIVTDSPVFRIHYRVVTLLLLCFGLVSTYDLYYGRPISCFTADHDDFPEGVVNDICWANSSLSFASDNASSPALSASSASVKIGYYKWVGFFLILQCIVFYLPHYCWLFCENRRMEQLVGKLQGKAKKQQRQEQQEMLLMQKRRKPRNAADEAAEKLAEDQATRFLERYFHNSHHRLLRSYAVEYLVCEAMNLVCVVVMLLLTDAFLSGEFHRVAAESFSLPGARSSDRTTSSTVFPRLVRCTFNAIDASGALIPRHAMCVLAESAKNEFIFSFLWLAYVVLVAVDLLTVAYRVVFVCSVRMRRFVLGRHCSCVKNEYVDAVALHCDISEFFVIFLLANNLGPGHFMRVLKVMAKIKRRSAELGHEGDAASLVYSSDGAIDSK